MHHNSWCLESIGARIGVSSSVPTPLPFMFFYVLCLTGDTFRFDCVCISKYTAITIKLHTGRRGRAGRSLCWIFEIFRVQISVRIPMTYSTSLGLHLTSPNKERDSVSNMRTPFPSRFFSHLTLHCFSSFTAWAFNISRAAGLGAPSTLGCIYVHCKFNKEANVRVT